MSCSIGIQNCYWWGTAIQDDLQQTLEATARLGAGHIELNPSVFLSLSPREGQDLKSRVESLGMGITVNGSMMSPDANLCSADPKVVEQGLERCRQVLEGCARLGSPTWSGVMHGLWRSRPTSRSFAQEARETRAQGLDGIRRAMALAEEYQVVLCLEVVNRYELFYLNTAQEGVDFCREVDSPYCKLLLDTFHMAIEENDMVEAIHLAARAGQLGSIHIGENNRRLPHPDTATLDWPAIGAAIRDSGFQGPVSLEPYGFSTAKNADSVCAWRDLADPDDLEAAARNGRIAIGYIRSLLGQ